MKDLIERKQLTQYQATRTRFDDVLYKQAKTFSFSVVIENKLKHTPAHTTVPQLSMSTTTHAIPNLSVTCTEEE
jgi:hypothetical protein